MKATINLRPDQYESRFSSCKVGDNVELSRECGLFACVKPQDTILIKEVGGEGLVTLAVLDPPTYTMDGYKMVVSGVAKCVVLETNFPEYGAAETQGGEGESFGPKPNLWWAKMRRGCYVSMMEDILGEEMARLKKDEKKHNLFESPA